MNCKCKMDCSLSLGNRVLIRVFLFTVRSDGHLAVGAMSIDAFEHVLCRVMQGACSSVPAPRVDGSRSVASEEPGDVVATRGERVLSNFAGSVSGSSVKSVSTGATGKPGKKLIRAW